MQSAAADNSTSLNAAEAALVDDAPAWPMALVVALVFFMATAPTLAWLEFLSSMANLVVATARETRRRGDWLIPTLEGGRRIAKPPLAAWISAASISKKTFAAIDSSNGSVRD